MPIAVKFIFYARDFPELESVEEREIERACNELEWSEIEEEVRIIVLNAIEEIRDEERE
jgi:hypothetical protein